MTEILNHTFITVSVGASILGFISGALGTFCVLRKQSLIGDGVAHSALLGVVLAFLIFQTKSLVILLLGGCVTGLISIFMINFIIKNSKIKFDSALAICISVFFGLATVFLTHIQKLPTASKSGIDSFIYGQTASMLIEDVKIIVIITCFILFLLILYWEKFKILTFDKVYASSMGVKNSEIVLDLLIIVAIIVGLQAVGVILMSSMLIAPTIIAMKLSNRLHIVVILSGFFGALSGFFGTCLSSIFSDVPTGPSIVIVASIMVVISSIFGKNGTIQWRKR